MPLRPAAFGTTAHRLPGQSCLAERHRLADRDGRVVVRADRLQLAAVEGARTLEAAKALAVPLHAILVKQRVAVVAAHAEHHRESLLHWSAGPSRPALSRATLPTPHRRTHPPRDARDLTSRLCV